MSFTIVMLAYVDENSSFLHKNMMLVATAWAVADLVAEVEMPFFAEWNLLGCVAPGANVIETCTQVLFSNEHLSVRQDVPL
jgi:hypothetical protein